VAGFEPAPPSSRTRVATWPSLKLLRFFACSRTFVHLWLRVAGGVAVRGGERIFGPLQVGGVMMPVTFAIATRTSRGCRVSQDMRGQIRAQASVGDHPLDHNSRDHITTATRTLRRNHCSPSSSCGRTIWPSRKNSSQGPTMPSCAPPLLSSLCCGGPRSSRCRSAEVKMRRPATLSEIACRRMPSWLPHQVDESRSSYCCGCPKHWGDALVRLWYLWSARSLTLHRGRFRADELGA
jgi:hypothetical protein